MSDVENEEVESGPSREDVEKQARSMGWTPQDQFRGDKSKWVDAEEFIERGEKLMPILQANNKRLQQDLLTRDQQIGTLSSKLQAAETAIQRLEKHYTEANRRQLEEQREQLLEQLEQAREDRNVKDEVKILDKLDEVRQAQKNAENHTPQAKNTNQEETPQAGTTPEFQAWLKENPWFGPDKKKTKLVSRIAEDLRDDGTPLQGREFFDEVLRLYDEQYGESGETSEKIETPQRRTPNKVEGTGNARSGSGVKSFETLPAEAKRACLDDAEDLVGPGKRYKTLDDWKKKYVSIYYGE